MFARIDEDEREIAPPEELALHPSNVVSVMVTFPVEGISDRLHSDAERARKRASISETAPQRRKSNRRHQI
jgi:hypothetical protein